jgi:outer membrane protein assembly factor BamB
MEKGVIMNHTNLSKTAVALCLILICAGSLFADDWNQWRGPNRDGKVTDFKAPEKWPQQLTQKWQVTVGTGDATPALLGDKIYLFTRQGGDEVTLCLNADTGDQIWMEKYEAQAVTGAAARHPGPRSSPAVAGGKVVTLGVAGVFSCLNAFDGKVIWRKDPFPSIVPKFFTSSSPIIVDGMAIAHLGGQGNGAVIAFDLADGGQKWQWAEEGPEYASPVLLTIDDTKQIVTLTEKNIVGIDVSDGKRLWKLPFAPARRAYNAATPIVDGQTVIYTGAARGTKAVKIEKQDDGFVPKELWSNPDLAPQYNTPVLKGDLLFGLSSESKLFCIDAADGKTAWIDETTHGRGGFGSMIDAGSCLLVLPSSAELIAFKASVEKYDQLAKIKVSETPTYAHPVIAGDRIYIKDQDTLTLWTLE